MKHCEGWWVGHPAQSQPLVALESKDATLFNIWNVLSPNVTWYFISPWSFLAIHHPGLQVKTGTHFKKLSLLTCLHVLLNPWRATNVAQAGFLTISYTCPCWGQEVGKDSHPSFWDLCACRAGWPRAGSVLGGGPGVPHHWCLWLKQRYTEDEVRLAYKAVWRK